MSEMDRFIQAQEEDYDRALKEIKNGKKVTCWMWYIFPQIQGLGTTYMSQKYAIKNIEEAIEYLNNVTLRNRLIEICQALLDTEEDNIHTIMGYPDDLKLRSSMTLFKKAEELSSVNCKDIFDEVIKKFYKGEDDPLTLNILCEQEKEKKEKENKNEKENENSSEIESKSDKENKNNNGRKESLNEEDNKIAHLDSIPTVSTVELNQANNEPINEIKDYNNKEAEHKINEADKNNKGKIDEDDDSQGKCIEKICNCNIM